MEEIKDDDCVDDPAKPFEEELEEEEEEEEDEDNVPVLFNRGLGEGDLRDAFGLVMYVLHLVLLLFGGVVVASVSRVRRVRRPVFRDNTGRMLLPDIIHSCSYHHLSSIPSTVTN